MAVRRKSDTVPAKNKKIMPPVHPGEVLRDILSEASLSANEVALSLRVPANRLTAILNGKRAITADTALRLGRYLGTSAAMWMNLQSKYDLQVAEDELREKIEREVIPRPAA